jgi:hypothetical protein
MHRIAGSLSTTAYVYPSLVGPVEDDQNKHGIGSFKKAGSTAVEKT